MTPTRDPAQILLPLRGPQETRHSQHVCCCPRGGGADVENASFPSVHAKAEASHPGSQVLISLISALGKTDQKMLLSIKPPSNPGLACSYIIAIPRSLFTHKNADHQLIWIMQNSFPKSIRQAQQYLPAIPHLVFPFTTSTIGICLTS